MDLASKTTPVEIKKCIKRKEIENRDAQQLGAKEEKDEHKGTQQTEEVEKALGSHTRYS